MPSTRKDKEPVLACVVGIDGERSGDEAGGHPRPPWRSERNTEPVPARCTDPAVGPVPTAVRRRLTQTIVEPVAVVTSSSAVEVGDEASERASLQRQQPEDEECTPAASGCGSTHC